MFKNLKLISISLTLFSFLSIQAETNKKKILTIGGAQKDVLLISKKDQNAFLLKGQKIELENPHETSFPGGGAVNGAIAFKKLDYDVSTFLKIGNDKTGKFFIKELEKRNISTDNIIISPKFGTGTSYLIPTDDGDNSVLVYRGTNEHLKEDEIPKKSIANSFLIYITSLSKDSIQILQPVLNEAIKNNTITALIPTKAQLMQECETLKKSLESVDILFLNKREAQLLSSNLENDNKKLEDKNKLPKLLKHEFVLEEFVKQIIKFGPKIVIVTNGSDGVYVATKNSLFYHPAISTTVISTTGAGDAFASTFTAELFKEKNSINSINDENIEKAICYGVLNSASVIGRLSANEGLLSQKELDGKFEVNKTDLIQKFNL